MHGRIERCYLPANKRVTDGARTRTLRSHNPPNRVVVGCRLLRKPLMQAIFLAHGCPLFPRIARSVVSAVVSIPARRTDRRTLRCLSLSCPSRRAEGTQRGPRTARLGSPILPVRRFQPFWRASSTSSGCGFSPTFAARILRGAQTNLLDAQTQTSVTRNTGVDQQWRGLSPLAASL
jgi:hypothetical protein